MEGIKNYIKNVWMRIKNSTFLKSVFTLSAGVVISQAVTLGTTPIISRIYDPKIIGDFSVITSYSIILGILVCLGLMSAIMIPQDENAAKGLCRLLLRLIVGISTLITVIAVAVSPWFRFFEVSMNYVGACLILYVYTVLNNISSVCYAYINRQKMYKVLFWNPTLGSVTNAAVSILLGLLGCGLWGYTMGNILAGLIIIIHMLRYANPFTQKLDKEHSSIALLKSYKTYPLILFPSDFIGTLARQIPVQMISKYWGNIILGSYSMCLSILGLPSKFLAGPVNRVFYREAAERYRNGENIGEFSFKILKANVKIALIPISILILFGKQIFSFVLGAKWADAGVMASYLGVYQLMAFCNSCLAGKYVIVQKKKTILLLNIAGLILYFITFNVCHMAHLSAMMTIGVYSIVGAIYALADTTIFMIQTKASMRSYIKFIICSLLFPVILLTLMRVFVLEKYLL